MLSINKGYIEYETSHLDNERATTYGETLERLANIQTNLFYNIVSSPNCGYEIKAGKGRIRKEFQQMSSQDRFFNIFKTKKLFGNPKGYFVNKISNQDKEEINSVSFTLANLEELPKHFEARDSEFGICFYHDFLQNKGITRVQYLDFQNPTFNAKLIFNSPYLTELYVKNKYEMKWENEWRIKGDLEFSAEDIAFVIVPVERYNEILNWAIEEEYKFPILTGLTYTSYLKHLFFIPQMENGWNQVRLCATEDDNGFKMDPYKIEHFTLEELEKFEKTHFFDLKCLAKNTLLDCYEMRYIKKFIKFTNEIKLRSLNDEIQKKFKKYLGNSEEPFYAESTLVNNLYTELFFLVQKGIKNYR